MDSKQISREFANALDGAAFRSLYESLAMITVSVDFDSTHWPAFGLPVVLCGLPLWTLGVTAIAIAGRLPAG